MLESGLQGKAVVVAAASRGIGRAVAEAFAREGARLTICARNRLTLERTADEIAEFSERPVAIVADTTTVSGCERFVLDAIAAYGRIDVLVVNGGPPPHGYGRFDDLHDEDWLRVLELTLFPAARLIRLALPELRKTRGNVVTLTATSAREPARYGALSSSSRAAVHAMIRNLAANLGPEGVRVNAVMPGMIATERNLRLDEQQSQRSGESVASVRGAIERTIPLRRYGLPEEVAAAVVFLASGRASYLTGVSLPVDGGELQSIF
jgi:3-oxoacyl-[acyl-carrier protein] reductase